MLFRSSLPARLSSAPLFRPVSLPSLSSGPSLFRPDSAPRDGVEERVSLPPLCLAQTEATLCAHASAPSLLLPLGPCTDTLCVAPALVAHERGEKGGREGGRREGREAGMFPPHWWPIVYSGTFHLGCLFTSLVSEREEKRPREASASAPSMSLVSEREETERRERRDRGC